MTSNRISTRIQILQQGGLNLCKFQLFFVEEPSTLLSLLTTFQHPYIYSIIQIIYNLLLKSMSKSPIKDYSRLLNNSRTVKKQENLYKYRSFENSDRILEEFKMKLELSLKHNAKLLDQNSVLSELVSELRHEVKGLNDQIIYLTQNEQQIQTKLDQQRKKLLDEIDIKQNNHDFELKRLLDEVSSLHKEKNDLQMIKNKEMELFKNQHEKNLVNCVQSLKNTYNNSKEIYETQIQKQKQVIENLEHQLQTEQVQRRLQFNRLSESIKSLENQIKHIKQMNHLEIQELKKGYETELIHERRNLEREKEVEITNYKVVVKRLKNDIYDKSQQIETLVKKMAKNDQLNSAELQHLKREKQSLLGDLATAQVHYANQKMLEKAKLKQINEIEIKNLVELNETEISLNKNEINGLKNLIDLKKEQIRRIYEENSMTKKSYVAEIQQLNNQNMRLRDRLKESERDHLQSLEAFKIKMSQLIDADIKSITNYFQNQINALTISNDDLQIINADIKEKLYKALNDNDETRKYFQIELSKQKARVQDLKIKLAAVNLEHKEHITSLGSKMEMTSMTLVREAEQKQRSQNFFEEEKKKFHSLSNSKDKEINDLMETMHRMKKMHEQELKVVRAEKKDLRDLVDAAQEKIIRVKEQYEDEMKRRTQKMKTEQPKDDKLHEEIKELFDKNEKIENQNIKLQKQVEHLARDNRALAQELGLKKGYIETLQLESCAAIEDEKSKIKILMGNNEVTLKEYFEQKIASREKDNEHLKTVIAEKEKDIRQLIVRYNGLEKRLQMLLESQEKVKEFEEKIKNLGLDTNLVKNMAQLFVRGK